jgi:hypothetical protein
MDALPVFFDFLKKKGLTKGHFLGFIHVLIGRRVTREDGTLISAGLGWREVASWLKKTRWDPEVVREVGQDPNALPPRDRQRFWYSAIAQAGVDSAAASAAGDCFAEALRSHGYVVGAAPKAQPEMRGE